MSTFTTIELLRLTREELFGLHRWIGSNLNHITNDCPERTIALENLRRIRQVLSHPHLVLR